MQDCPARCCRSSTLSCKILGCRGNSEEICLLFAYLRLSSKLYGLGACFLISHGCQTCVARLISTSLKTFPILQWYDPVSCEIWIVHLNPVTGRWMSHRFFLIRDSVFVCFTPRYRMHGSICHFPSKHFYGNRLENVENLKLLPASASVWPQPDERVVWIDCDSPHQQGRVIQVGNSRCLLRLTVFFGRGSSWEWG